MEFLDTRFGFKVRLQAPRPTTDVIERFTALVLERDCGQDTACWIWQGGATFYVSECLITTPRKFIYEHATGDILPAGVRLTASCRTPKCCRPTHLRCKSTQ